MTVKNSVLVNIGIFVCAMVVLCVILEAGLAIIGINTKSNIRFVEDKGTTFVPHAYYRHTKEGFSEGYFNAHGFRDYERTYQKPEETFRILILGDSYTEALQVSLEKTFPALLEKKLNDTTHSPKFEVLNLGQSGFGTADAYMRYLNFGVQYSPDLVILAFLTGNDFRNNSKLLNEESVAFYFVFDENNELVLDRSLFDAYRNDMTLLKKMFQSLKRHSYLASLLSERMYLWELQRQEQDLSNRVTNNGAASTSTLEDFSDLNIYIPKLRPLWREAFNITAGVVLKFRDSVRQNGSDFLLVTLSNPEQVQEEIQQDVVQRYDVTFDFEQPDTFLEKLAQRNEITFLKLLPVLKDYYLTTGKPLHGFGSSLGLGHWNEEGHNVAAETIFKFLHERGLVPSSA
ncbi:MAG: hypothetical protein NPIRA04_28040 [Nitrospirales bacterium]|nr:MAG: hypothetical protein NPIRA04_28040 [Nitrospirales bacterium]